MLACFLDELPMVLATTISCSYNVQEEAENILGMALAFEFSKPTASDILPPARPSLKDVTN